MSYEKKRLVDRKKIRTYSKRLVTALSTICFIGYIAGLIFNISTLSLCCTAVSIIFSALSFALNIWSLTDHFRKRNLNKQLGIENTPGQEKLTKIHINIASSASFLIGGIIPILLLESPIIPFIFTTFFILGYAAMTANIVRSMISEPQVEKGLENEKQPLIGNAA